MTTTDNWTTEITLRGPAGIDTERLAVHLLDVLDGSACGYGPATVTATFTAHGATYSTAHADALEQLARIPLPDGWELAELDLARADLADFQLAQPTIPALVGISEAARILGVSRQRAHAIASTDAFPDPVAELAAGPVYLETAVRAFAAIPRKAGRPRHAAGPTNTGAPPTDAIRAAGSYQMRAPVGPRANIRTNAKKAPTRNG